MGQHYNYYRKTSFPFIICIIFFSKKKCKVKNKKQLQNNEDKNTKKCL